MTVITKKIALKCDTDGCDALAEKTDILKRRIRADPPLQKVRRKTLRRFGGGISFA